MHESYNNNKDVRISVRWKIDWFSTEKERKRRKKIARELCRMLFFSL
jgi:hypothetical protein